MLEKFIKMQLNRSAGFFLAACIGAVLGAIWMIEPMLNGVSDSFKFAPGIVFSVAAFLAWTKGFDKLVGEGFCSPVSSLMVTLPVSEEEIIDGESIIGTFSSFLMYFCIGVIALYMTGSEEGMLFVFTSLSAMFIDLSYTAWSGAISIGLIPILILLEQYLTVLILINVNLKIRNHHILQKLTLVICLAVLFLQVLGNLVIIANCKAVIAVAHPLILEGGLVMGMILATVYLRKQGIRCLKYGYND